MIVTLVGGMLAVVYLQLTWGRCLLSPPAHKVTKLQQSDDIVVLRSVLMQVIKLNGI